MFKLIMKIKNILTLGLGLLSVGCLVNCDGGSSGDSTSTGDKVVTVPSNTDIVNDVNDDSTSDDSGADDSLTQQYSAQIFNQINSRRLGSNLSALTRDSDLDALAESHNAYLISIANPGGSIVTNHDNVQGRANVAFGKGYVAYGENTAGIRGFASGVVASTFVNGWIASPGHLDNIEGNFTHTGVATSVDSRDGTIFSTQIFAR